MYQIKTQGLSRLHQKTRYVLYQKPSLNINYKYILHRHTEKEREIDVGEKNREIKNWKNLKNILN